MPELYNKYSPAAVQTDVIIHSNLCSKKQRADRSVVSDENLTS